MLLNKIPFSKGSIFSFLIIFLFLWVIPSFSLAAVVVFDRVTTVGTPIYLKVLTKGRFLAQGGVRVTFYLDQKQLGKTLTGGDGYGYFKYTPQQKGLQKIEVHTEDDTGSGMLLVMDMSEKAIVIEIEGGLKTAFLSESAIAQSKDAVSAISQSYRIIYLTRILGTTLSRKWLENQKFPQSTVIRWRGPRIFEYLKEKKVKLSVFVGSAALLSKAIKYFENSYTFEETEEGKKVTDWSQVTKLLLNGEKN
jgi:hypothetical protein